MQVTDVDAGNLATHRPMGVQSVPVAAIDSTMALGFYCGSAADADLLAAAVCFARAVLCSYSLMHLMRCAWRVLVQQAVAVSPAALLPAVVSLAHGVVYVFSHGGKASRGEGGGGVGEGQAHTSACVVAMHRSRAGARVLCRRAPAAGRRACAVRHGGVGLLSDHWFEQQLRRHASVACMQCLISLLKCALRGPQPGSSGVWG